MKTKIVELAYKGEWEELLKLLRSQPELVNTAKEPKGYTPLHQAAWHGASPAVIGELLALGANPSLRTTIKGQTPCEVAAEKHEARADLQFLLHSKGRTAAQLIRKVAADNKHFFGSYDGNQLLCDRFIEAFGADIGCQVESNFEERFTAAFKAATGKDLSVRASVPICIGTSFRMEAQPDFWANRFLTSFCDCASRSHTTPIEKHWATVTDLFDPVPDAWGLRGDLYLWLEMRSALNHIPIPTKPGDLAKLISSLFFVLTGEELSSRTEVRVPRLERGGMSSGMVSGEFWHDTFIPMLQHRTQWLHEAFGSR